jgi:hypothetical protein
MTFRIIGGVLEFDGRQIAVLLPRIPTSLIDRVTKTPPTSKRTFPTSHLELRGAKVQQISCGEAKAIIAR